MNPLRTYQLKDGIAAIAMDDGKANDVEFSALG